MPKLKVSVTQEDIDNGQAGGRKCPIALALTRATGRNLGVAFSYFSFYKDVGSKIPLPEEVTKFIHAFDAGRITGNVVDGIKPETTEDLKPFDFEVDLPEASANAEVKPE